MSDFRKHLERSLQDPEFRRAWEERELKYQIISEFIRLRNEKKMTQAELAEKAGTTQAVISRLERGNANLTLSMMERIAKVFGRKVQISFA